MLAWALLALLASCSSEEAVTGIGAAPAPAPPAAAHAIGGAASPHGRSLQTVMSPRRSSVSTLLGASGSPAKLGTGVFTSFVCPFNAGITSFSPGTGNPVAAFLTCNQGYYHSGGTPWAAQWYSDCQPSFAAGAYTFDYSAVAFAAPVAAPPANGYASGTDPTCGGRGVAGTPCFCRAPITVGSPLAGTATCLMCPVGYYSLGPGATNATCSGACPAGRFGNTTGLTSAACSGLCEAGSYCPQASSSATQIRCPAGSFCPAGAGAPTPCPAGYFCPSGSSVGTANACPAGTFCPQGSTAASPCAPPLQLTSSAQLTATPGSWNWTCNAGFWGPVVVRACSTTTGTFTGAPPVCTPCSPPALPAMASSTNPNPSVWAYTCNAGYFGAPASRTCNGADGTFSGAPITCAPCPSNGTYCAGGTDGTIRACPGGTYGNAARLTSPACSGACQEGYFCPAGSTTATANPCGGPSFFCPVGSGAPTPVPLGYYSAPTSDATGTLRTSIIPCPPLRACSNGLIQSAIVWAGCPAALSAPEYTMGIINASASGAPPFAIQTPGDGGGYSVSITSQVGCALSGGGNLSWSNASSALAIVGAPGLVYAACQGGAVVTLTAARRSNGALTAACTFSLNVTQVIRAPVVTDCGPRVLTERNLLAAAVAFPQGAGLGATTPGLQASVSNVGTTVTWALGAAAAGLPFSIGVCDGILRATAAGLLLSAQRSYIIPVTATNDGRSLGIGTASAACNATVTLLPAPQPPQLATTRFTMLDMSPNGTLLGNVGAFDVDGYPIRALNIVPNSGSGWNSFAVSARGNLTLSLAPPAPPLLQAFLTGVFTLTFTLNVSSPFVWGPVVVTITVTPVAQAPVCSEQSRTLPELSPRATLVGAPLTAFTTLPAGSLTYSFPSPNALFNLTAATGQVLVATGGAALTYAITQSFAYTVQVTDTNGRYATCQLTIALTPVPKPPIWVSAGAGVGAWAWNLTEGTLPWGSSGATSGSVGRLLGVAAQSLAVNGSVTYAITAMGGPAMAPPYPFTIDTFGGAISVNPLWPGASTAGLLWNASYAYPGGAFTYVFTVRATDAAYGTSITGTARVTLVAIRPRFNAPPTVSLPANSTGGTLVVQLSSYVTTVYSLATLSYLPLPSVLTAEGAPTFVVTPSGAVSLVLPGPTFNVNTKATYAIPFSVVDTATTQVATSLLTVNLLPSNRPPVWAAAAAAPPGLTCTPISQTINFNCSDLSALVSDADIPLGLGEALTFSITAGNGLGYFAINPANGVLRVLSFVTFPVPSLNLTITVTDAGINGPRMSAATHINVTFVPLTESPTLPPAYAFTVLEHAPQGAAVGLASGSTVLRIGGTDTPQLTYDLSWAGASINAPFPFRIDTLTKTALLPFGAGNLTVDYYSNVLAGVANQGPISFSPYLGAGPTAAPCTLTPATATAKVFQGTITATDSHLPYPLTAQTAVTVTVQWRPAAPFWDPATVPPIYPTATFALLRFIREKSPAGTNATSVASTDPAAPSAPLTAFIKDCFLAPYLQYALVPASPYFAISATTGAITTRAGAPLISFAATPSFSITVTATVLGAPPPFTAANGLQATASLTLLTTEVNSPAVWTCAGCGLLSTPRQLPIPNITISEATPQGTVIGFLNASDPNSPATPWGARLYSLPGSPSFSVDALSGAISVTAGGVPLSWTLQSVHLLTAVVTDASGPGTALSTPYNFTIHLTFSPVILVTAIALAPATPPAQGVNVPTSPLYATTFSNHAILVSGSGGQVMQVNGTGFGRAGSGTVTFALLGGAGSGSSSLTGSCTVVVANTYATCVLPPGFGIGYALLLTVSGFPAATPSALLIGYFPPTLTAAYLSTCSAPPQQVSPLCNSNMVFGGPAAIHLAGTELGPRTAPVSLYYGPAANPTRYFSRNCSVLTASVLVQCPVVAGVGGNLTFTLITGSSFSNALNTSLLRYAPPTVTGVTASGTLGTAGSGAVAVLNVTGTNFGPAATQAGDVLLFLGDGVAGGLRLGPVACTIATPGTSARCPMPPGVGTLWRLYMSIGGQLSAPSAPGTHVSYAPPNVTSLTMLGSQPLTPVSTTGGAGVLLWGSNFGPVLGAAATSAIAAAAAASPALAARLAPTARYGKPTGAYILNFTAVNCAVVAADSVIQCQFGAGTGTGLRWQLAVGGQLSSLSPAAFATAYQPPVVSSFTGPGTLSATSGAQAVTILGSNFGPATTPAALLAATYGANATPSGLGYSNFEFTAQGCAVTLDHVQMTCNTAPGAGVGMQWAVLVDSQRSIVATTAYQAPVVTGVVCAACPLGQFSPAGGEVVQVSGQNFGQEASFLDFVVYGPGGSGFSASSCNITVPHTLITCFTAPGAGGGHTWSVSVRGQYSLPAPITTSYTSPMLVAIVGAGGAGSSVPAVTAATPSTITLLCRNLPLQSRNYITFLQVGNGPDTLGTPYLRTATLDVPVTAAAIAAAMRPDGSVAIAVSLPSPSWASPALPLPATCNLHDSPWALGAANPYAGGDPACATPDIAGGQVSFQLLVLPVAALGQLPGGVISAPAVLALGGTVSTLSPATTLAFAGPDITNIVVSGPTWLTNTSLPCAFLDPQSSAQISPAWSCADSAVLQIMISGANFGGNAPGLQRQLKWCPGNCTLPTALWSSPVEPAAPLGVGPVAALGGSAPLFVASWSATRIVAYTTATSGGIMVSLGSSAWSAAALPPPPMVALAAFADISPTVLQLCLSPIPYTAPAPECITPSPSAQQNFPTTSPPFPSIGDASPPTRILSLLVTQLQGATGVTVSVGGVPAVLCDASGAPIAPGEVKARVLDTQGTSAPYTWLILFLVPPGQGLYVPVVLTRTRLGDAPTPTDFSATLNYAPPLITRVDVVRPPPLNTTTSYPATVDPVSGALSFASGPITLPTAGGATVLITGTNLGTAPYLELGPLAANTSQLLPGSASLTPCGPAFSCWSFPSLIGEGAGLALGLWQGGGGRGGSESLGQPQAPLFIPWTYDAPTITAVTSLSADFPTQGGSQLLFTGTNFGRSWPGNVVTLAFGMASMEPSAWVLSCLEVTVLSQGSLACTLPEGSGGNLSVAITVSGVVGMSRDVFSYAPPVVLSASSSAGGTPGAALPAAAAVVALGAAPPSTWTFPVLRGGTPGGDVITLTGRNFGTPSPSNCAFLSWAGAPTPVPPTEADIAAAAGSSSNPWGPLAATGAYVPYCDNLEDWLGEGEIFRGSILAWNHTFIAFATPPGLGLKHLQLSISGNLLHPPRSAAHPAAPPHIPRFMYSDPVVYDMRNAQPSDALPPALVGTNGGNVLIINGSNFGPGSLNLSFASASAAFRPLPLDCAAATPCAANAATAFPVVLFHRYCLAPSNFLPGYATQTGGAYAPLTISTITPPAPTTMYYCNPTPAVLLSFTHNRIVLIATPGLGSARNATVSILSAGWGSNAAAPLSAPVQQTAAASLTFSYQPPTISNYVPSVVRVRLPPGAPTVVGIVGTNFGTSLNYTLEGVSNDVSASISGFSCGPPAGMPFLRAANTGGVEMLTCILDAPNVLMGPASVAITMAGQTGFRGVAPPAAALLLACDAGYYGRPNETCLPCPAQGATTESTGAACDGFLDYLPDPNDPTTYISAAAQLALAYTAPSDPRFTYPRPLKGWYNLNSSDAFSRKLDEAAGLAPGATGAAMAAACPPENKAPGRDSCIVPCAPASSCIGNNYCAPGYASKPPMFRCASCDAGFYKSAGQCIPCPASPVALVVSMGLVLVAAAAALFYLNKRQVDIAVLSIGVDFFQVLAIFAELGVTWPPPVLNLMRLLSAFNLNIEIVAPECLIPNLSYQQKFGFILLLPLAIASVFALVYSLMVFWKRCLRGIRDRRKVYSHSPAMVSSLLVLVYLLYLYLTRTLLNILDCTPTKPPDGYLYLKVVFERCGVPGGTQLTLLPVALAGLGFYSLGYPFFMWRLLTRNKELIYEDQLLRAKGVGNDRLTNPNALDFRRKYGRSYFQFRPQWYWWVLVIIARKFCIACVAVIFSSSVGFQMASCLMIMFLAYTLQVQVRPYMCSDDYEPELKAFKAAVAAQDALALRLKATMDSIETRGRKRLPARSVLAVIAAGGSKIDRRALMRAVGSWVFNYNTVEAVMSFCAVIVCLSGLMYQSELNQSTGITGTIDAITGLIMFIVITAIVYFFSALCSEVYVGITEALALNAARRNKKTSVLASGSNSLEEGGSNIEAEVNPMFLSADGTSAKLGSSKDSLVASILAQKESPPLQLWTVFRDEFASLVDRLKESQVKAAEGSAALQKLAALTDTSRERTSVHKKRSEVEAAPVKRVAEVGEGGASPLSGGGAGGSGGEGGGARRGIMSTLRDSMGRSPLSSSRAAEASAPSAFGGLRLQNPMAPTSSASAGEVQGAVAGFNPLHGGSALSAKKSPTAAAAVAAAADEAAPTPFKEETTATATGSSSSSSSSPAAGADYPGLPPGWSHRLTSKGKVLFFNEETQETAFKLEKIPGYPHSPAAGAAASFKLAAFPARAAAAEPAAAPPPDSSKGSEGAEEEVLPEGWASRLTSKGKRMYYHEVDGRTAWSIAKIPRD